MIDRDALVARVRSVSYIALMPATDQQAIVDNVPALVRDFPPNFSMPYVSDLLLCSNLSNVTQIGPRPVHLTRHSNRSSPARVDRRLISVALSVSSPAGIQTRPAVRSTFFNRRWTDARRAQIVHCRTPSVFRPERDESQLHGDSGRKSRVTDLLVG